MLSCGIRNPPSGLLKLYTPPSSGSAIENVFTLLQGLKSVQQVSSEELEQLFDSFERTEHARGEVICSQGQSPTHLGILRLGELTTTTKKAKPLKETGGFAYYGEDPTKASLTPSKLPNPCLPTFSAHWLTLESPCLQYSDCFRNGFVLNRSCFL